LAPLGRSAAETTAAVQPIIGGAHNFGDLLATLGPAFMREPPAMRYKTFARANNPTWSRFGGIFQPGYTTGDAAMHKNLIAISAAAFLVMTAAHAADPGILIMPHRFRAAHPPVPSAVGGHKGDVTLETAAAPDAAAFNAHIARWRSFDVPGAVNGTQPAGINDLGEVTGAYYDSNGNQHGFLRKEGGKIVTFDAPDVGYPTQPTLGSSGTIPTGINNEGDIVGYYTDAKGAYHGFVRSARGRFWIIDDPSSTSAPSATIAQAINDWGTVVGFWFDSSLNSHGFVHQVDGSFTTVDPPGDLFAECYHINDLGEVGGDWVDAATFTYHGMLLHSDGKLVTFDAPNGGNDTFGGLGQALNLWGNFAGTYADANYGVHAYVRYANGKFAEFTAPGGGTSNFNGTWSASLNLLGTVVGYSVRPDGSTVDGYVRFADGELILANAPVTGQQSTVVWAINDFNEFTGYWFDATGAEHGFVALAVP
jgi:uncharacterized membrane protein